MVSVFYRNCSCLTHYFGCFYDILLMNISYFFFRFTAMFLLLFLFIAFLILENVKDNFFDWSLVYEHNSKCPLFAEIDMLFIFSTVFLRFCNSLYSYCFSYSD